MSGPNELPGMWDESDLSGGWADSGAPDPYQPCSHECNGCPTCDPGLRPSAVSGPNERDEIAEPILLQSIRRMAERDPECHVRIINGTGTTVRGFVSEVDDWLAERDRRTAATAWREGHAAGRDYQGDGWNQDAHDPDDDNPYREADQ